jgi:uncharacterized membrane protein YidH (DUF202 family)
VTSDDTSAARERTVLAWQRTALTALVVALGIARLGTGPAWAGDIAAAILIVVAAICGLCGRLRVTSQRGSALPAPFLGALGLGVGVTGAVLALALVTD